MRKKLIKCYIWSIALYGAETWTLRAADQKHLENFEMWCWRRTEISWTDHARHEEVLLRVNEQRNDSYQRFVLTQFVSPDDEHDVLETCRELKT